MWIIAGTGVYYDWLEGKSSAWLCTGFMRKWREGSCFFPPVYLSLQLESPWQCFYWSLSKFLPHTLTLSSRGVSLNGCRHACRKSLRLSLGLYSLTLFWCSLVVYFYILPFFSFSSICRFCTAAADRKLRLLTSDLQDKHEVKVMQHLEHIGQNCACQLASNFLYLALTFGT